MKNGVRTVFAVAVGLALVTLYWWLVSGSLTLESWKVGAVPAAVGGLAVGRWAGARWYLGIPIAIWSIALGSWLPVHADLVATAIGDRPKPNELLLQAIRQMEAGEQTPREVDAPRPARILVSPWMSLQMAWERGTQDVLGTLFHAAIALAVSLQAVRMSSPRV